MWYKFDTDRFAEQMLPPLLRSKVLLALLRAILRPLRRLLLEFRRFRDNVRQRLNITGQTFSLEEALRRKYGLPYGAIYVTDTKDKQIYLFYDNEARELLYLRKVLEAQTPVFISFSDEGKHDADFIVHIPSFLKSEEEEIRRILEIYKPAGRTYKIQYYDYE